MGQRCVSLDVWGTMLDLHKAYVLIAERLAAHLDSPAREVLERLRVAAREARRARRREGWSDWRRGAAIVASSLGVSVDTLLSAVERALLSEPRVLVLPGVVEALRELRGRGLRLGVLGNVLFWPGWLTRRLLEAVGIAELLDAMLFADEIGYSKPAREAFERMASALGCSVESIVHVGDRIDEDVAGAVLAGGSGVLVWSRMIREPVCIHDRLCAAPDFRSITSILG